MDKITAQEFADKVVAPPYRQSLKSLDEALDALGWERVDRPMCCGSEVDVRSIIGSAYFAQCRSCGKFIVDICGPSFGQSWVSFIDPEKVVVEGGRTWISGTEQR